MDDEHIYEQVAAELEAGNRKEGLWAKCFAECDGDDNKAKALYLKTRVEQLTGKKKRKPKNQSSVEDLYYVNDEDEEFGPFTKSQLQSKLSEFSVEALYELEGTGDWYNLHTQWSGERERQKKRPRSLYRKKSRDARAVGDGGLPVLPDPSAQKQYNAVGGWLMLFCIQLIICNPTGTCCFTMPNEDIEALVVRLGASAETVSVQEIKGMLGKIDEEIESKPELADFNTFQNLSFYISAALSVISIVVGCLLLTTEPWALKWAKVYLWSVLLWGIFGLFIILILTYNSGVREHFGWGLVRYGFPMTLGTVTYFAIWYTYLLKSKRVKGTYINNSTT